MVGDGVLVVSLSFSMCALLKCRLLSLYISLLAGVLVEAMRKGHWIILDELNLAPTDVLEALNRVGFKHSFLTPSFVEQVMLL